MIPAPHSHRIRLKGPWHYEWLRPIPPPEAIGTTSAAPSGVVKMPATWQSLFGNVSGTVCFRRRFQRPTNLDPNERVSIVFDGLGGSAEIRLNGVKLGAIDAHQTAGRFEITSLLKKSGNELTVVLSFDATRDGHAPGGLWGPVVIEIQGD